MSLNIVDKKKAQLEDEQMKSRGVNAFLWVMVIVAVAIAALGNIYFTEQFSAPVRIIGMILLLVIALGLAAITNQGKRALTFFKESKIELRKIVWPTRQETTQTTLIIIGVTVVVSLILWGLDSIIMTLVTFLTDLRF